VSPVLKKRRNAVQPNKEPSSAGASHVVPINSTSMNRDPLDRLVIYLAKKAALEDHLAGLVED